jgi:hypothetical protein
MMLAICRLLTTACHLTSRARYGRCGCGIPKSCDNQPDQLRTADRLVGWQEHEANVGWAGDGEAAAEQGRARHVIGCGRLDG